MSFFNRESKASLVRLCEIYEKNIVWYDPLFSNGGFSLNFIVSRVQFIDEIDIKVVFIIHDKALWGKLKEDPIGFKKVISNYSAYFVIDDFHVVLPYRPLKASKILQTKFFSLKDRVSFEHFCDYEI
jgi:hypothetical protein